MINNIKLTATDELFRTTTYEYDVMGRNTAVIEPDGKKTAYEYKYIVSEICSYMLYNICD